MVTKIMKGGKMDNKIIIGIVVLGLILAGGYLFYTSGAEVSAQGQSTITVVPDTASVYLNLESKTDTAQEAKDNLNTINDKVLTELLKIGIERKDIQTLNYNIYPNYDYSNGNNKINGYIASQQLIIKTSNFDKVASIVDKSVDAGALVSSINFELSPAKEGEYKAQALKEASADGRMKAESTAQGLGKSLGRLVSVNSEQFNYPGPMMYYARGEVGTAADAKKAAVNIAPNDIQVTASVEVRYKLSLF